MRRRRHGLPVIGLGALTALILAAGHTPAMGPSLVDLLRGGAPGVPSVHLVRQTPAQKLPGEQWAPAATDQSTGTIYQFGPLDNSQMAHEVGHVFDTEVLTDGDRQQIEGLLGMKGPWNQGTGTGGVHSPDEAFADMYSAVATRMDPRHRWESSYVSPPAPGTYKRFVRLLDAIGQRQHLGRYARPSVTP